MIPQITNGKFVSGEGGGNKFPLKWPSPLLPPIHEQINFYTGRVFLYNRIAHRCCCKGILWKRAWTRHGKNNGLFIFFFFFTEYKISHVEHVARRNDWSINGNKIGRDFVCGHQRSRFPSVRNRYVPPSPPPPPPLERSSIKRRVGHTRPRATSAISKPRGRSTAPRNPRPQTSTPAVRCTFRYTRGCNRAEKRGGDSIFSIVGLSRQISISTRFCGLLGSHAILKRGCSLFFFSSLLFWKLFHFRS